MGLLPCAAPCLHSGRAALAMRYTRKMEHLDVQTIAAAVGQCADSFHFSRAYLFGSYARNEQDGSSDVDLCIECDPGFSLFTLGGLGRHLEGIFGVPVDIVCGEQSFHPRARERYQRDKVLVYEKP